MSVPLTLAQRFARYVLNDKLITPGMKLVVAVSGGADSVALLHLLHQMRTDAHLSLIAVHINHHLRKEESDLDEKFVRRLCDRLNINCIVKHVRFSTDRDLENQARLARREILYNILKSYKFDRIALAHQKDDQAETILLNLVRGSGITGMGGIKPDGDSTIRPLLTFSRAEIETWLKENRFDWRTDSSNADSKFTRNKIRLELIPWLQENLNPGITDRLTTQATIFRNADSFLRAHTGRMLKKLVLEDDSEHIKLDLPLLKQLSEIEQYYILRNCYSQLSRTEQEFFQYNFEEVRQILKSEGSKQTKLAHGIWVLKQYDELILTTINPAKEISEARELVIDEERTHFVFLNWRFTLKYLKNVPKNLPDGKFSRHILIDLNKVSLPLRLRCRLPGDRFIPTGMSIEKKLKEFFIDEKVPKFDRDKVPILTDSEKIIWIVGHRADARGVCTEPTNRILHIVVEPVTTGRKRAANRSFNIAGGKYDIYDL
jgi:tRNA(Ile)-lysidine synthase